MDLGAATFWTVSCLEEKLTLGSREFVGAEGG